MKVRQRDIKKIRKKLHDLGAIDIDVRSYSFGERKLWVSFEIVLERYYLIIEDDIIFLHKSHEQIYNTTSMKLMFNELDVLFKQIVSIDEFF